MGWLMSEQEIFIQHAKNHGERSVELMKEDASTYLKKVGGYREYKDSLTPKVVKVVYEYYG